MLPPHIIIALDYSDAHSALALAEQLDPALCRLKVGKALFTAAGPSIIEKLQSRGFSIFLDLKFHDIPNTVQQACQIAADLGVWMLNVHASGGLAMLAAAREGVNRAANRPLLIGVTVLTSLEEIDLQAIGIQEPPEKQVLRLASLVHQAGLDGVVCSSFEVPALRQAFGQAFCLVTPGIRPLEAAVDDQSRISTPQAAITAGSDYLVIGRPITASSNPQQALENLLKIIATENAGHSTFIE